MIKALHITLALLIANLATLLLVPISVNGNSSHILNFIYVILSASILTSLVIALPILIALSRINTLNIFSITSVSMLVALPWFMLLNVGPITLIIFLPTLIGSLLFWSYMKYVRLLSNNLRRTYFSLGLVLIVASIPLYLAQSLQKSTGSNQNLTELNERNSYIALDKEMIKSIENEKKKGNSSQP